MRRFPTTATATHQQRRGMAQMPVPQSAKAKLWQGHPEREGWESTMAWFYGVGFIMIVACVGFTPNTDIQAWARQEASARLALKGAGKTDFEFGTHYQQKTDEELAGDWDKFGDKALRMNEDDDEDEEEEEDEEDEDEDDDE
jgi:hypothetical protein